MDDRLVIIGGGLAGCEAAWQAAQQGVQVQLHEMRPSQTTPAHTTDRLAELVCSNSLGSATVTRAAGLLKAELTGWGSLILSSAQATAVPAGSALAVDRRRFAELVTLRIEQHPLIELTRGEVRVIPDRPTIIATGPLTSDELAGEIARLTGNEYLYFFDALAPIVSKESIDLSIAFYESRHGIGDQNEGDYINCPLNKVEYQAFVDALVSAEQIELRDFEREDAAFFEGCLPVEIIARRGSDGLRFGPMRPIGLTDPRSGRRPYAAVQLRQDDLADTMYNLVGFQTNLRWGEQRRVIGLIPGLAGAEILRYGMMHRNTYVNSPELLQPTLQYRGRSDLFFAGQITGVEGYMGNAATGLLAGINAARLIQGKQPIILPTTTMLGALCHYITHASTRDFQPMKANFGLFAPPQQKLPKTERYLYYSNRALTAMRRFARERGLSYDHRRAEALLPVAGETSSIS